MTEAKNGDTAKVHYTGKLEDGQVFASSRGEQPLEFTLGEGQLLQGFEKGVIGMQVGESKTVSIPPEEGYGNARDELMVTVNRSDFPPDAALEVGQRFQLQDNQGNPINVAVSEIENDTITLDANHPLSGKTLIFDIELMELNG